MPTVLLEPRFRGAIRKLKYKDTKSEQPRVQDMMAYKVNKFVIITILTLVITNRLGPAKYARKNWAFRITGLFYVVSKHL